jgi:hypothetical protein
MAGLICGTAEAVPFLRESFRTSATFGFCLLSNRESEAQIIFGTFAARPRPMDTKHFSAACKALPVLRDLSFSSRRPSFTKFDHTL